MSAIDPVINWMKCKICAHIFTDGYFNDDINKRIFSSTNDNQQLGHDIEKNRHISARMIERVLPYQSSGVWMDIGIGNGSLIFTAEEFGFDVIGFDLRQSSVDTLRKLGYKGYCADFQEFDQPESCSVISMADVLEHMPFPVPSIRHMCALLKKGGVALITLPNTENMLWRLLDLQKSNPYWGELEHYHNFSRTRIFDLLDTNGLRPLSYGVSERYRIGMEVVAVKK